MTMGEHIGWSLFLDSACGLPPEYRKCRKFTHENFHVFLGAFLKHRNFHIISIHYCIGAMKSTHENEKIGHLDKIMKLLHSALL